MATQTGSSSVKRSVPPAVIAICITLLLAFMGWLAYANMFAPPKPLPMSRDAQTNHDWIKSMATKSGGDISKLSEEEQQKLMKMTGGYGAQAMKATLSESQ
jgi:hypothetical protein